MEHETQKTNINYTKLNEDLLEATKGRLQFRNIPIRAFGFRAWQNYRKDQFHPVTHEVVGENKPKGEVLVGIYTDARYPSNCILVERKNENVTPEEMEDLKSYLDWWIKTKGGLGKKYDEEQTTCL